MTGWFTRRGSFRRLGEAMFRFALTGTLWVSIVALTVKWYGVDIDLFHTWSIVGGVLLFVFIAQLIFPTGAGGE